MPQFQSKVLLVDALQWDGSSESFDEIIATGWIHPKRVKMDSEYGKVTIKLDPGDFPLHPSDWVVLFDDRSDDVAILHDYVFNLLYIPFHEE